MNLILFTPEEIANSLPRDDPRAEHILSILRRAPGDSFDAGILNGAKGKAILTDITAKSLILEFNLTEEPPPLYPVGLLVGLPRPQTARKIIQECASLGVSELHFAQTDKSEPSYRESRLWTTDECQRRLIAGAEQAFTTRIPRLLLHASMVDAMEAIGQERSIVALDNYEATGPLRDFKPVWLPCLLAVGGERGWSGAERDLMRDRAIPLLQLGRNVLRTETACLCGLTLLMAKLKLM